MMRGMFAAISGLKTHQVMLDVTSNDIANVNTIGYKSARATFKDSLTQLQRGASGPGGGTGGANAAQVGLGTQLGSIDNLMTVGRSAVARATRSTSRSRARASSASPRHGRAAGREPGRRRVHPRRQLHHQQRRLPGHPGRLLRPGPDTGARRRHADPDPARVDQRRDRPERRGQLRRRRPAARQSAGFLTLATFSNTAGLERSGNNRWLRERQLGRARRSAPRAPHVGFTTAGAIEMSNVDLAQSFTSMITAQRGFQANSRVISVSDEMLQRPGQPQALVAPSARRRRLERARHRRALSRSTVGARGR